MKHQRPRFAPAALLLAAAAFPFTPLAAQDTQPAPPPPAAQQPPAPPVADVPAPPPPAAAAPAPAPVQVERAPAPAPATAAATAPAPRSAPVRASRPAPRIVPRIPAPAPVAAPAVTTTTTTTAPPTVAVTPPPVAIPSTTTPETIPAAPSTGVDTVPPPAPRQQQPSLNQRTATWPWLVLGALLIAAAALLFARRRRRDRADVYEETYVPEAAPVAVAPVAAAAAEPAGEPDIALRMRPVRAGVAGADARVEFELTVDNRGSGPARDVRVSTWMLAAGSSEAEQALIEPRGAADTPPVTLGAGEARTLEAQVALPTSEIDGDAVLPVVVADARYLLADGSEAHATARFAVGVPDGEELAHFATDNPSGLHEGVVAHSLGETERA